MAGNLSGKLIVSEMLCFIQNQILSTPKNVIIDTCTKFYASEEIKFEKMKYFDAVGARATHRRGANQNLSNLTDVIDKMIASDLGQIPRIIADQDGSASL